MRSRRPCSLTPTPASTSGCSSPAPRPRETGPLKPGGLRSGLDAGRQFADKLTRPIRNGVTHCLRHHSSLAYRAMHQTFLPRTATPASRRVSGRAAARSARTSSPANARKFRFSQNPPGSLAGRGCSTGHKRIDLSGSPLRTACSISTVSCAARPADPVAMRMHTYSGRAGASSLQELEG
jgi:hypothetical protein